MSKLLALIKNRRSGLPWICLKLSTTIVDAGGKERAQESRYFADAAGGRIQGSEWVKVIVLRRIIS